MCYTFDGMCSTILRYINGTTPDDAAKKTNKRLTTGTHSNASTSKPEDLRKQYNAKINIPKAEPSREMISNVLRPKVSDNVAVHKFPINCVTAIEIAEICGSIFVAPAALKIITAYVVKTRNPVMHAKAANTDPFKIPINAERLTK